ncbi:hypothetical protein N321_06253, partial [Antrostomus carolinensis]
NLSLNVVHTYIVFNSFLSIIAKPSDTQISSRPFSVSTSL